LSNRTRKRQPRPAALRVAGAAQILEVLGEFGVDAAELLAETGIDPELFADPDNRITYAARDRLFKQCVSRTGCQYFGLIVGQRMDLNDLGLVGFLMRTSPDVGAALKVLVNLLHLHSQGAAMTLRVDEEVAMLTYDAFESGLEATDQTGAGAVAMMLNVMHTLCGPEFRPAEASFAHRRPADISAFRSFFKVPLYFDAEHFALVFSHDWLNVCPLGADDELRRLLGKQVAALEAEFSLEFPDQVRKVLRSTLITNHHSEGYIAELFSMRSHTFSRRLETFGTSFRELVDECRFDIAREMLRNTSLGIGEIGASMGYTRASSFIRAFRRWSGVTPGEWRKSD
jgi:AraC-like DNA-binding protein